MKITNVTATVLRLPEISTAADGTQDDLIITVETDEGIIGYGEVDTAPYVGKAVIDAYMSHGTCYGLREVVVGADDQLRIKRSLPVPHEVFVQCVRWVIYSVAKTGAA